MSYLFLLSKMRSFFRRIGRESESNLREAIEELIEESPASETSVESDEKQILGNILNLRDLTASDVMVPRADIIAAPVTFTKDALQSLFAKHRVTLLPIYQNTLDQVIGIISIKDFIGAVSQKIPFHIRSLVKEVFFISPTMRTMDLLLKMRGSGTKLAIVVDEYGGVDGLVTFSNLIEEVIGDIQDAHEPPHSASTLKTSHDGSIIVQGRIPIEDLEKGIGMSLTTPDEQDEIDTLAGLLTSLAGHVPARGERIEHPQGIEFEVLEADPRRIQLVAIRHTQEPTT